MPGPSFKPGMAVLLQASADAVRQMQTSRLGFKTSPL